MNISSDSGNQLIDKTSLALVGRRARSPTGESKDGQYRLLLKGDLSGRPFGDEGYRRVPVRGFFPSIEGLDVAGSEVEPFAVCPSVGEATMPVVLDSKRIVSIDGVNRRLFGRRRFQQSPTY